MSQEDWEPLAMAKNNGDFISIKSYSGYALMMADPEAPEFLLEADVSDDILGNSVVKALKNSRFLSLEEAREVKLCMSDYYKVWVQKIMNKYGYKTKKALFKNMKNCRILSKEGTIIVRPSNHETLEGWSGDGIKEEDYVTLPVGSSFSEIGAALRLGFSRCK